MPCVVNTYQYFEDLERSTNEDIVLKGTAERASGLNGRSSLVGWVIGLGKEEDRTIQVSILYNHEVCQPV